jgi:Right handed beta helix region
VGVAALATALVLVPALAFGHIERASYWPDPAPDTSVTPPAGGAVPAYRPLFTALDEAPPGETHVVCQGRRSITLLEESIRATRQAGGFSYRPHGEEIPFTTADGDTLLTFNRRLLAQCSYDSIQAAVNAAGNNDRIVVMPGIYKEPASRAAPTNDPACDGLEEENDRGQTGALSYAYQFNCPNDQNLIAIMGREPRNDEVEQPPLEDRHGIPDEGPCIRCNLQLEGSGVDADDVVVDAGRVKAGNGGPANPVKDVGIRADRADGFVLSNLTVRHAAEHGIYVPETDGALLQRFKTFHNEEYGVLTFVPDHHVIQDCDAAGSGDAAIYPGSSADTQTYRDQKDTAFYPGPDRFSSEIRRCDMHHSSAGYSGTAANAVWVHHNDFYDNALGFTTDVFTAAGHPGYPQNSDLIEHNNFFSNNFNPYQQGSDVVPTIPVPVGTGLWIAGGNDNELRNNHFWDNWRRGTMLFAVPDSFVCGENPVAGGNQRAGCDETEINTSFDNRFHDNVMSRRPDGTQDPNGVDFWWDQFAGNTGNCWYDNVGELGTRESLTADPPLFPRRGRSVPQFLPEDCATSIGTSDPPAETELLGCFAAFGAGADVGQCSWFTTPPEPQPRG